MTAKRTCGRPAQQRLSCRLQAFRAPAAATEKCREYEDDGVFGTHTLVEVVDATVRGLKGAGAERIVHAVDLEGTHEGRGGGRRASVVDPVVVLRVITAGR
jgi:hypothetical protein